MNTDIGFTNIIYQFLDPNDLENLSLCNKELNKDIKEKCKDKLFVSKVKKLPILQSSIHWMANRDSKPIRYHWNKTNFTPEEKAKINIHLLDNLCEYEIPKYGYEGVIFTLHSNGLMCQLPSNSHVIREYERNSGKEEYVFMRLFGVNTFYEVDTKDKLKYKNIKIQVYSSFNLDDFPEMKLIVQLMEDYYKQREGKIKYTETKSFEHYLGRYIDDLFR